MRRLVASLVVFIWALPAYGAQVNPETTRLPWKNGSDGNTTYHLADHPNKVHVFEVFSLNCSWCDRNASQVKALAAEFADDPRVQFIDLGLDTQNQDYQRWISRHRPSYPVVQDVNRAVYNALKSENGIPQTYVVDCAGILVDQTIGYWGDAEKKTLRDAVARAKTTVCD